LGRGGRLEARWTTWLTGAVDKRVVAILPIVIDVVNLVPSMDHHFAAYGFWAPAVGDYVRNGVMDRRFEPNYDKLVRLVDPYYYRHRLTIPKLVLNSAGDQFFLPDSSRFYFDELRGEKLLRYVPNSDHSLRDSDAVESVGAFFWAIANDVSRPRYTWKFEDDGAIRVRANDAPREVRLWQATNRKARDFRLEEIGATYESTVLSRSPDGSWVARVAKPATGYRAFFVELTFDIGAPVPLKLSTAVRVIPDVLPHLDTLEAQKRRLRERAAKSSKAARPTE